MARAANPLIQSDEPNGTARRLEYLRAHNMSLEFANEIPEGVNKIAINGILNDPARAAQGHVAHRNMDEKTSHFIFNTTRPRESFLI